MNAREVSRPEVAFDPFRKTGVGEASENLDLMYNMFTVLSCLRLASVSLGLFNPLFLYEGHVSYCRFGMLLPCPVSSNRYREALV